MSGIKMHLHPYATCNQLTKASSKPEFAMLWCTVRLLAIKKKKQEVHTIFDKSHPTFLFQKKMSKPKIKLCSSYQFMAPLKKIWFETKIWFALLVWIVYLCSCQAFLRCQPAFLWSVGLMFNQQSGTLTKQKEICVWNTAQGDCTSPL